MDAVHVPRDPSAMSYIAAAIAVAMLMVGCMMALLNTTGYGY